jgi:hypothetical protein
LELNYDVDVKASLDDIQKTIVIEGEAIDVSVNKNNWMVPSEDLDYFASTLQGVQLRINHGIDVTDVKGLVKKSWRDGSRVLFEAEVSSDPVLLTQIEKKYLTMVSPKVVSDEIVCSLCSGRTRDDNMVMVHLCAGAYEIVHKPRCVELSIVAEGAYPNNTFHPKGFAAAMDDSQRKALIASVCKCADKTTCPCGIKELQSKVQIGIYDLNQKTKEEKKQMSAEKETPPAEKAGTELTYQTFVDEMTKNTTQIMDACNKAISEASSKIEAKLETDVKAAVAALIPKAKPTGKGQAGSLNTSLNFPLDDAQKLNNIFAKKANLQKAGLELAAAAKRMNGLTADVTHTEEEEE